MYRSPRRTPAEEPSRQKKLYDAARASSSSRSARCASLLFLRAATQSEISPTTQVVLKPTAMPRKPATRCVQYCISSPITSPHHARPIDPVPAIHSWHQQALVASLFARHKSCLLMTRAIYPSTKASVRSYLQYSAWSARGARASLLSQCRSGDSMAAGAAAPARYPSRCLVLGTGTRVYYRVGMVHELRSERRPHGVDLGGFAESRWRHSRCAARIGG